MSRALNINATSDHVSATCLRLGAPVSVIETLPSGITRLVLRTADAAAIIARAYGESVITQAVERTPLALASRGVPITQK